MRRVWGVSDVAFAVGMLILVSKPRRSLTHVMAPNLGQLVQPRSWWLPDGSLPWAADNDAYNGFDEGRFVAMLERIAGVPNCLWVAAPDVVGDASATLDLFDGYWRLVDSYKLPVAFVAQDGLVPDDVPWQLVDALFVGGSTEWKLSGYAAAVVRRAKSEGKQVHMGRVNSMRRLRYAKSIGCDSVDGTRYARFTDMSLPPALTFAALDSQGGLF